MTKVLLPLTFIFSPLLVMAQESTAPDPRGFVYLLCESSYALPGRPQAMPDQFVLGDSDWSPSLAGLKIAIRQDLAMKKPADVAITAFQQYADPEFNEPHSTILQHSYGQLENTALNLKDIGSLAGLTLRTSTNGTPAAVLRISKDIFRHSRNPKLNDVFVTGTAVMTRDDLGRDQLTKQAAVMNMDLGCVTIDGSTEESLDYLIRLQVTFNH